MTDWELGKMLPAPPPTPALDHTRAACRGVYAQGIDLMTFRHAEKYAEMCTGCEIQPECFETGRILFRAPDGCIGLWGGVFYTKDRKVRDWR